MNQAKLAPKQPMFKDMKNAGGFQIRQLATTLSTKFCNEFRYDFKYGTDKRAMLFSLSHYIDHTLLRADSTKEDIHKLCHEALIHHFAAVCILPCHVEYAVQQLSNSSVKVCSVVGFPLGANTIETKCFEAAQLVALGAQEIDMVINIGALKAQNFQMVENEISAVVKDASPAIIKVIIETCLLTEEEKIRACRLAVNAGAHFVKTSTGYSKAGATVSDISLMHKSIPASVGVKASGGIRDYATAKAMIDAGANRIGTSSGIAIVTHSLRLPTEGQTDG